MTILTRELQSHVDQAGDAVGPPEAKTWPSARTLESRKDRVEKRVLRRKQLPMPPTMSKTAHRRLSQARRVLSPAHRRSSLNSNNPSSSKVIITLRTRISRPLQLRQSPESTRTRPSYPPTHSRRHSTRLAQASPSRLQWLLALQLKPTVMRSTFKRLLQPPHLEHSQRTPLRALAVVPPLPAGRKV